MPGVDMLGNTYTPNGQGEQFGNTRAIRELHSAANQAGHNRMLSETYGGAGWEINFTNYKRLVDWEVALGVNFVNQHLSFFTIKGVIVEHRISGHAEVVGETTLPARGIAFVDVGAAVLFLQGADVMRRRCSEKG